MVNAALRNKVMLFMRDPSMLLACSVVGRVVSTGAVMAVLSGGPGRLSEQKGRQATGR